MRNVSDFNKEEQLRKVLIDNLYHHALSHYIAIANRNDVIQSLWKFFSDANVAIISKDQLRAYQEMEKRVLDTSLINPAPPIGDK